VRVIECQPDDAHGRVDRVLDKIGQVSAERKGESDDSGKRSPGPTSGVRRPYILLVAPGMCLFGGRSRGCLLDDQALIGAWHVILEEIHMGGVSGARRVEKQPEWKVDYSTTLYGRQNMRR
jgi:hypothetical protein